MTQTSPRPVFYGWYIVAIAFLANFMAVGTGFYAFNAFLEPLCAAHGWTRTQVNMALMLGTPFGLLGQFFFGTLVMRIGVKKLMIIGSLISGIAFMLVFQVSSLWLFYLFYILLYVGNGAYGGIVANSAVSNWFIRKRGKALGIATAGMSLSGAVLPLAAMMMISRLGMGATAVLIGALVLMVAPLVCLVVVNWPEDRGLKPDGVIEPRFNGEPKLTGGLAMGITTPGIPLEPSCVLDEGSRWTLGRLARTSVFWKVGPAYAMAMIGVVGVMSQLKPRFVDVGFADTTAMLLMAATALAGTLGKYVWGALCDVIAAPKMASTIMAINGIGLLAALFVHSPAAIGLFVCLFGFAMGGVMSTYPILVADLFGRKAFPSVFRFMGGVLVFQMLGFGIAGASFDRFGSYTPAYVLFMGLDVIAALMLLSVKRLPAACDD
ncbi:MAG: MFS transporter [Thermodesulfobacteriota bacterium]|nr:MFS transporter [Thermodesulfobacteriota bacterium]